VIDSVSTQTESQSAKPSLTAAKMREDLAVLRTQWAPFDKSFSAEQRTQLDQTIKEAMARADGLSPADFALSVMRAAAISRNGHTRASVGTMLDDLPVRAWWFADGLYIIAAHPQFADLLGARIDRFGALTPDEALQRAAPFISGSDQRIRYLGTVYLMAPALLRHIGVTADAGEIPLTLRMPNGAVRSTLLGRPPSPDPGDRHNPVLSGYSVLIPDPVDMPGRWMHVLDHVPRGPAIYWPPTDLAQDWIGDYHNVLYLRSNTITGLDNSALDQKLFGVLQNAIVARAPQFVVVDLRLNNGGNFFNTVLFAQALPQLLPPAGRIFVLVSRATFSAALVTAAMLKGHGGDRVTLIGETMGDNSRFWAENSDVRLPNSGIIVSYSTGFHDWTGGCSDPQRCYWPVVAFATRIPSLEPEIRIEPRFADYAAGRDPVLDTALVLAR
jgi:hypothetical protein